MRFAIVGTGFRARAFCTLAAALPDLFDVSAILPHRPLDDNDRAALGLPVAGDLGELLGTRPGFVLTTAGPDATPDLMRELTDRGVPALAETPPALDESTLQALWRDVGSRGLVQVAEQYPRHPMTAARIAAVRSGLIGTPTSAQVSMTQTYHAVAILRALLGVGLTDADVRATTHTAPLVAPVSRAGWTRDREEHPTVTTTATLDFGDAIGHYDFTEGQTRNPLRASRVLVRGSRGEIIDDALTRLVDETTVVTSGFERRQTGLHHDFEAPELDQISLDGSVLFHNPYVGARLSDEEIAMASLLEAMGRWVADEGPEPYPLADAAQDQLLGLAIRRASETGASVRVVREAWAA
ncbi:gfo/Idh/MocA family oxidoreductase [Planctomonas sp. JC2975]|nr:gfo/Idh/MocA family oxidoreductase [Planctomonas sp. JC2975]